MWRSWVKISWLAAAIATQVCAQTEWLVPACPMRMLFAIQAPVGRQVLLPIAFDDMEPRPTAFTVFNPARQKIAWRLAYSSAVNAWLLVETDVRDRLHPYTVYCGATPDNDGLALPPVAPDSTPVSVQIGRIESKAVPTTWDQMRYLYRGIHKQHHPQYLPSFQALATNNNPGAGGLMVMRATVLCPQSGVYGFIIDDANAAFLLIDNEPATRCDGHARTEPPRSNDTVRLTGGPHLFEIYRSYSRINGDLRLAWRMPGERDFTPVPDNCLLTAQVGQPIRREHIDKTVHASFTFNKDPAYAFPGRAPVFIPVKFNATSVNWISSNLRTRWDFGDGSEGEGEVVRHVYAGLDRYRVTMEVHDRLGFVSRCSALVDCRQEMPAVFPFAAAVAALPAICYPTDTVEPLLRLAGDMPPEMPLDVTWEIRARQGRYESQARSIAMGREAQLVPLTKGAAGELAGIRWNIMHHTVPIATGSIDFALPPFASLPRTVVGDCLITDTGARLVLVPIEHRGIFAQPPIAAPEVFSRIVCLDDSLAAPGLLRATNYPAYDRVLAQLIARPGGPPVAYLPLAGVGNPVSEAQASLVWLATVAEAVSTNELYILSLGLNAMLAGQEPAAFERQVAALCDLVTITKQSRMLLVTPPPYPRADDRIRLFAIAIKRVADARGIPIADLFTAFKGYGDAAPALFDPDFLGPSEAGQDLAGRIIAAALRQTEETDHH